MRQLTFRQVLVVPTLATLGLGLLLAAQDISFTGPVGMAAPIVEPVMPKLRIAMDTTTPNAIELPGFQEEADSVKATSQEELKRMARASSGREDPFVPLMAPDPTVVVPPPLPEATPAPPPPPPNAKGPVRMAKRVIKVKVKDPITGKIKEVTRTVLEPVYQIVPDEPEWTVTGVFSTGYDVLAIVEMGDTTREVRDGDILDDNTQVLSINSQSVTLYKNGRKYTKSIGE